VQIFRKEHDAQRALRAAHVSPRGGDRWSKEFLEAGKKRLAGDTAREATSDEVKELKAEARQLKETLAEVLIENRLSDRYLDLAEYHRLRGRTTKADRLAAIAEAYYQAAPDDDDEPEAAAMAMPVPRPPINTNAVSTTRVPNPRADEPSGLAPSPAH
jgi:hypothetical protein